MCEDDPVPLKAGGEAAPELMRALYALDDVRPDPARRARVLSRLALRVAATPEPAVADDRWSSPTLITGLAIGLAALLWFAL